MRKFFEPKIKKANIAVDGTNKKSRKIIYNFYKKGFKFPNIISNFVFKNTILSDGILIGHGVVINAFSKIDLIV